MKIGDSIPFYPPANMSNPKRELIGMVTAVGKDGTVDLTADDGHETPYEGVPVIPEGEPHPAAGPFAVAAPIEAPAETKRGKK